MPCDPPLVCVNNSLHGLLWNRSMEVVNDSVQEGQASVTLRYDFPGTDPGYPFKLRTEITYTLVTQTGRGGFYGSQFIVSVAFTNLDHAGWPLPVYNGWHPYILCHTSASIITLDPCTDWAHVDVGTGKEYPPPRFSNMVPIGHVSPSTLNGSQPIGGKERRSLLSTFIASLGLTLVGSCRDCGCANLSRRRVQGLATKQQSLRSQQPWIQATQRRRQVQDETHRSGDGLCDNSVSRIALPASLDRSAGNLWCRRCGPRASVIDVRCFQQPQRPTHLGQRRDVHERVLARD